MEEQELGYPEDIQQASLTRRLVFVALALALALVSFFVLGREATSPEAMAPTVASLDEKKATVTSLMASSTGSSAAISLLPGDAGTPIAEKLVDLSSDFLVVLAAIYLEKYLLAIMGHVTFKLLIPVSCALFALGVLLDRRFGVRAVLLRLAARLAFFGLAVWIAVPASAFVSDVIEKTYEDSINQTIATAEQTSQDIEASGQAAQGGSDAAEGTAATSGLLETLQNLPSSFTDTVAGLTEDAQNSLNNFVDALAVMIVTSCVIPVLVLLFFLWLANVLLGVHIEMPGRLLSPRSLARRR